MTLPNETWVVMDSPSMCYMTAPNQTWAVMDSPSTCALTPPNQTWAVKDSPSFHMRHDCTQPDLGVTDSPSMCPDEGTIVVSSPSAITAIT